MRRGDSLIGLRVRDGLDMLRRLSGLFASSAIQGAENAAEGMRQIEAISDADIAEVHESAALFQGVEENTSELRGLLDFLCGLRWLTAGMKVKARTKFEEPLVDLLEQNSANALGLLARGPVDAGAVNKGNLETSLPRFAEVWRDARDIADRESFLHWEAAFPGVWQGWQDDRPTGGFDAVIGNPPLGPHQAARGRMVRLPRTRSGTGSDCRRAQAAHPRYDRDKGDTLRVPVRRGEEAG